MTCHHCYHIYGGALHMVIPDGHVVVKCCKCPRIATVHREHMSHIHRRVPRWSVLQDTV